MDSQKIAAICTISQFISSSFFHSKEKLTHNNIESVFEWINSLIDILLDNIGEKNDLIRKHCFKGIGNISLLLKYEQKEDSTSNEKEDEHIDLMNLEIQPDSQFKFKLVAKRTQAVLNCLFAGMEDHSAICAREALFSLQKIIDLLEPSIVKPNILNLLLRLPESFERLLAIYNMYVWMIL